MPSPISPNLDPTLPPEISNEEDEARMSLISAHPTGPHQSPAAPPAADVAPQAPASPAVASLVSRFSVPSGSHPPVEPSLTKALLDCKLPIANYLVNAGTVVGTALESGGASLLGLGRIAGAAAAVQICIDQNEAAQVQDGNHANAVADCKSAGAIALSAADGSVICEK